MTDGILKDFYGEMCTACDWFLFPYLSGGLEVRLNILENTLDSIIIETVAFKYPPFDGAFVKYQFKKEEGIWKLADFEARSVTKGNGFNITVDEAISYIEKSYIPEDFSTGTAEFLDYYWGI